MLSEYRNARVIDPLHPSNGQVCSLYVEDGHFVPLPRKDQRPGEIADLRGALVLAGGIDIHTHIGGGKVNLARMLMADKPQESRALWPTIRTGELYNRMGYTACFEPAMLLSSARHTHLELADTPHIDSGAYVVLGNEDWLLEALGKSMGDAELQELVAWSVHATRAMAVKVVNAGGINAFKFNQRTLDVDEPNAKYGVTPRDVIRRLSAAVEELGLPHPLHVHASNLGSPGNIASTLATLEAAEGRRLHLTHAQFNCYSSEGPHGMGSGAGQLAKYVNTHDNISIDVGQVVFGQTVTISADTAGQWRTKSHASGNGWIVSDIECQAGCGVVPIRYQDRRYVHSLQWTIGLELMLLIEDPWRVFLTTDHPNGGPFTSYPHLIRLLMDRSFRLASLEAIHPLAAERTVLQELDREYTLEEIAIITRAAPARILGMPNRGTLKPGALADFAAYRQGSDWEATFSNAEHVVKRGVAVIQDGQATGLQAECETLCASIPGDARLGNKWRSSIESTLLLPWSSLQISDWEMESLIRRTQSSYLASGQCRSDGVKHGD